MIGDIKIIKTRKVDMFKHADFMNRNFHGLIDPGKMLNPHGNVMYEMNGGRTWTFNYAKVNYDNINGIYMIAQDSHKGDIYIMDKDWLKTGYTHFGEKFQDYEAFLRCMSIKKKTNIHNLHYEKAEFRS